MTLWKPYAHNFELVATISESNYLKDYLNYKSVSWIHVVGIIPVLRENSVGDITASIGEIEFSENKMKEIESGAFKNLDGVQKLSIICNNLTRLVPGVFENLTIHSLDLSDNQIESVSTEAFKNLPQLTSLRLDNNKIKTLENGIFVNLQSLNNLELYNNEISSLPDRFCKNIPLNRLMLSKNKIGELRKEIFLDCNITHLDLDNNNLSKLDFFKSLPTLRIVHLNHNRIKSIPKEIFNHHSNLRVIDITHNQIDFIDPEAFDNMPELTIIELGNNNLTKIDPHWFSNTSNIKELRLQFNQIEEIPEEAFRNIDNENLRVISLNHNRIKRISRNAFKGCRHLDGLSLSNNDIHYWNGNFLGDAADAGYISFLNLENNKIVCPEGDFDHAFKARWTSLRFNNLTQNCVKKIENWCFSHSKIVST